MINKIQTVTIIILILIIGISTSIMKSRTSKYEQLYNLEKAMLDTMKATYDSKLKTYLYEKELLIAEKEHLDKFLKEKDKELYNLRKKFKAEVGTIIVTETRVDTVIKYETIELDYKNREIRSAHVKNEFLDITIKSYPDSISLYPLRIFNKQSIIMEPDGTLMVMNSNPYVTVTDMKGFKIEKPKEKSKNWKFLIGIGAGVVGGYFLAK